MLSWGWGLEQGLAVNKYKGYLGSNGYVLTLDCDDGSENFTLKSLDYTPKVGKFMT